MKYGCLFARGDYVIFADADGATDINSLEKVLDGCKKIVKNGLSCAIGSRYEEGSDADRTAIRRFLSWGMNTLVKFVFNNDMIFHSGSEVVDAHDRLLHSISA